MKMKGLLKSSMFVAALLAGTSAYAATFTVDGINYEPLTETTCKVAETLVAEGTTAVVVPQTVECNTVSLTVTEIGDKAFKGSNYNTNSKIKSFTLPETIEKIGKEAFAETLGNTGEFVIPAACTEIGESAFFNTRFTTITVLGAVKTIGTQAFTSASFSSITFPEGLETVSDFAFGNNTKLVEVDFPSTLSSIGFLPFQGSTKLAKVTCRATTPPSVGMFLSVSNATLYVPEASVDAYKANSNWKQFKAIEPIKEVGVEAVDAEGVKVVAKGGVINVAGAEGDVEVYNAAGQLLYKGADEAISVPAKGITIVKVGGKAVKVAL